MAEIKLANRDIRFDILKTIGILSIILIHAKPSLAIAQIRNFDVPLMVMVSGSLFYYSFSKKHISFWDYLRKRIPRLVAPVWLFLCFFFGSTYIVYSLTDFEDFYHFEKILSSFLLLEGIGYVWIIRVFILMAIISPLILRLSKYFTNQLNFVVLLFISLGLYELIFNKLQIGSNNNLILSQFVESYLFYLFPYAFVLGIGIALPQIKNKTIVIISLISLAICSAFAWHYFRVAGEFIETQAYKYPPRMYYISYAVGISTLLYFAVDKFLQNYSEFLNKKLQWLVSFIVFVSSSSMWIYLWHIYLLHYWSLILTNFSIANDFRLTFIVISSLSIAITYLQKNLVEAVITKTKFGKKHQDLMTILFLK